ncbi:hypothetical protein U6B65_08715 [Oscillospiraceae bacterium MB08-C2-2]|nr:hypothetical protein U6B65_08715 [Oscillospiraceae bacterium MB08-C2-2]
MQQPGWLKAYWLGGFFALLVAVMTSLFLGWGWPFSPAGLWLWCLLGGAPVSLVLRYRKHPPKSRMVKGRRVLLPPARETVQQNTGRRTMVIVNRPNTANSQKRLFSRSNLVGSVGILALSSISIPREARDITVAGTLIFSGLQGVLIGVSTAMAYGLGSRSAVSRLFPPSEPLGWYCSAVGLVLAMLFWGGMVTAKKMGRTKSRGWLAVLPGMLFLWVGCLWPPAEKALRLGDISVYHWLTLIMLAAAPSILIRFFLTVQELFRK